jgi:hypothetical protein
LIGAICASVVWLLVFDRRRRWWPDESNLPVDPIGRNLRRTVVVLVAGLVVFVGASLIASVLYRRYVNFLADSTNDLLSTADFAQRASPSRTSLVPATTRQTQGVLRALLQRQADPRAESYRRQALVGELVATILFAWLFLGGAAHG